jgi:hypothetical protein
MPKDAHNKAAEHHDSAAKSHRLATDQHGKGEHAKGRFDTIGMGYSNVISPPLQ